MSKSVMTRIHINLWNEIKNIQEEFEKENGLSLTFSDASKILCRRYKRKYDIDLPEL